MYLHFLSGSGPIAPFKKQKNKKNGFVFCLLHYLVFFFHIAWRISWIVFVLLLSFIPKCLSAHSLHNLSKLFALVRISLASLHVCLAAASRAE